MTKKIAQHEGWKLSSIWGKNRAIAWESAFQIDLRNHFQRGRGEDQYICDFGEGWVWVDLKNSYYKKKKFEYVVIDLK